MKLDQKFRAAGLAVLLLGSGLGSAAMAQETEQKSNIIIKRFGADGKPVRAEGDHAIAMRAMECAGNQKAESDVASGEGDQKFRTRVVICSKDGSPASAEQRAKLADALEKAKSQLGAHREMSAERLAEAAAALDREIARLRAQDGK